MPFTRLAEFLSLEGIETDLQAKDKQGTLRALARLLVQARPGLDEDDVYRVFQERERLASTGVGSGVAIPHGRTSIEDFQIVVGISRTGVEFDSVDGELAQIFVAVLAPEQHPAGHLRILAHISRVLRDGAVRDRLLRAPSSQAALDIMREEELRH